MKSKRKLKNLQTQQGDKKDYFNANKNLKNNIFIC